MSELPHDRTEATKEEIKWAYNMRKLIKLKPETCSLMADESLWLVDAWQMKHHHELDCFQPLSGVASLGRCDGGDPWM